MANKVVTPFVGVWIETEYGPCTKRPHYVTPFVGVWIETYKLSLYEKYRDVTPFVGVWIETYKLYCYNSMLRSHPSWVCGLKLSQCFANI